MKSRWAGIASLILMGLTLLGLLAGASAPLMPWAVWFFIFLLPAWRGLKPLRPVILVISTVAFFIFISDFFGKNQGTREDASGAGTSPEAGEAIFWARGKCHICHSVGERGSAVRGPNLGDGEFGGAIGARATERIKEKAGRDAPLASPTEYLVEALSYPGAYVVEGFKNEMPQAYLPPIALSPAEIKAVVAYLQSLGGVVDVDAIRLPPEVIQAAETPTEPFLPYMTLVDTAEDTLFRGLIPGAMGDPWEGERLFFESTGNAACALCHVAATLDGGQRGGQVGPELISVAGTRTPQFILESILDPSALVASGFGQVRVDTRDGRILSGIPRETDSTVLLSRQEGDRLVEDTIPVADILQKREIASSMMPQNFAALLTIQELHDILAYLLTQTGEGPLSRNDSVPTTAGGATVEMGEGPGGAAGAGGEGAPDTAAGGTMDTSEAAE